MFRGGWPVVDSGWRGFLMDCFPQNLLPLSIPLDDPWILGVIISIPRDLIINRFDINSKLSRGKYIIPIYI